VKEKQNTKVHLSDNRGTEKVKEKKRKFFEPELEIYDNLTDITLFSSTQNVSGGAFF